jgi:outer membrane receptor protein involved in Fe transport
VSFKRQDPWSYEGNIYYEATEYVTQNTRTTGSVEASIQPNDMINFNFGGSYYVDGSEKTATGVDSIIPFYGNDEYKVSYNTSGVFGEVMLNHNIGNVVVGARYDNHNIYGSAFVPRFSYTKAFDKLHFKALYANSFRAPVIYNIEYNPDIKPEKTTSIEAEVGYLIGKNMSLTLNVFQIKTTDPIIYWERVIDGATEFNYYNVDKTGTQGAEFGYRYKGKKAGATLGYSFYKSSGNEVEVYMVEDNEDMHRGLPQHKLNVGGYVNLLEKLTLRANVVYNSEKYSYQTFDVDWETWGPLKFDPTTIINVSVAYRDLIKGLTLEAGVYDLLDQRFQAVNTYDAGSYPVPFVGRELAFKIKYAFDRTEK